MLALTARIIFTVLIIAYALLPALADFNPSHVLNPNWPGHARLHVVWLIAENALFGILALYLIWIRRSRGTLMLAGLFGAIVFGGFLIAGGTASLYGGTLADPNGVEPIAEGVNGNVILFSTGFVLSLVGLGLVLRTD